MARGTGGCNRAFPSRRVVYVQYEPPSGLQLWWWVMDNGQGKSRSGHLSGPSVFLSPSLTILTSLPFLFYLFFDLGAPPFLTSPSLALFSNCYSILLILLLRRSRAPFNCSWTITTALSSSKFVVLNSAGFAEECNCGEGNPRLATGIPEFQHATCDLRPATSIILL